jgi:hypothetical protein
VPWSLVVVGRLHETRAAVRLRSDRDPTRPSPQAKQGREGKVEFISRGAGISDYAPEPIVAVGLA